MSKPNVLWLMSDQHNANCTGYAGNPNVKTPNLDDLANEGVEFEQGFCNNPICSPSRLSFITGLYTNNHGYLGNRNNDVTTPNPNTLSSLFRRFGYQTGLVGKSHMITGWDKEGFEYIRYTDMCDADDNDPHTCHYFDYLAQRGLADHYEEGSPKEGQQTLDGSQPASLPYKHSIEHYTGNKSLEFLENRDQDRPFFLKMSFQRPHDPITPAPEDFDMYNPEDIVLPESISDLFENKFVGKPQFMQDYVANPGDYPMCVADEAKLKRALASYYALITKIDEEIGRVIDHLKETGEYDNTIIFYTADHGDFAGEHGLFLKNLGIYESIHRIPFLLKWPGGPTGVKNKELVESVDWYATLCDLCNIQAPDNVDGRSLVPVAKGEAKGSDAIICEHHTSTAIRTKQYRLVYYRETGEGELYDRGNDPDELNNLWSHADYQSIRMDLMQQVLNYHMSYQRKTYNELDQVINKKRKHSFSALLQKEKAYYSDLIKVYETKKPWPPQAK
ncbi:putative sulfatase [Lentisphaera araneosa HTCC2155]|uniref:Putative sulfatase n=1 Tax=Lentisphaera araneosa HTCC2155 TaxID=313628 RepID=A6DLX7_9BACT|nr:sulfatase-like hydrolase/transferase [Lentisphaera araneosa]EDM27275.1 putative sulfatase [Lentisphaera araneosa HTCC2155]